MGMNEHPVRLWLWLSVGLFACGGEDETQIPGLPGEEVTSAPEPTFWQHVAPIMNDRCVACHQTGGIAPFALDNFEDAERRASLIADMRANASCRLI
jgi:hypothetical protein